MKKINEKIVKISEIESLIRDGYTVEIDSPDGFVPVSEYVVKGNYEGYEAKCNGKTVIVNEDHLFDTTRGWIKAKDIELFDVCLTDDGYHHEIVVYRTGKIVPIVDIQVEHPNHRYFANGISGHNTNVGKSAIMCHLAANFAQSGEQVLYVSCEMSESVCAKRIDANLLDTPMNAIDLMSQSDYVRRMKHVQHTMSRGGLVIKQYPPGFFTANHLRALLSDLKVKKQFVPTVVFVDYLTICASTRFEAAAGSYTVGKAIAEEMRGVAITHNFAMFSAAQTNRGAYGTDSPGIESTSESMGIPMTADLQIIMSTSDELMKLNQILFNIVKSRFEDKKNLKKFLLGVDYSKMKFYSLGQNGNLTGNGGGGASHVPQAGNKAGNSQPSFVGPTTQSLAMPGVPAKKFDVA